MLLNFNQFCIFLGDKIPYPTYFYNVTNSKYYFNILRTTAPEEFDYFTKYLDQCYVRSAIHVGNQEFSNGSIVENYMLEDIAKSTADWLAILLDNYRVMIYNGQLDIICGLPLTETYLAQLTWKNSDAYKTADRSIWKVHPSDTEVAGYVREAGDFLQVAVRNGKVGKSSFQRLGAG
jgi:vitellogenic carboxypeptidase-like protein